MRYQVRYRQNGTVMGKMGFKSETEAREFTQSLTADEGSIEIWWYWWNYIARAWRQGRIA